MITRLLDARKCPANSKSKLNQIYLYPISIYLSILSTTELSPNVIPFHLFPAAHEHGADLRGDPLPSGRKRLGQPPRLLAGD